MARIALVHDWLTGMRGGEKCLQAFLELYPNADIYTLIHVKGSCDAKIDERVAGTSCLQRLPGVRRYYRVLLPFYPIAVKSLDLSGYDFVISLSHAAAKNVQVDPGATHVCYCFTPMRYIWDQASTYFGALTPALSPILSYLRNWDRNSSSGVQHFVAISKFIAARIRCFYGRKADVIYPPVDTSWIKPAKGGLGEAFLYAGALVPYKRSDLAVEVCTNNQLPLWVAGGGPEEKRLRSIAGPNVKFLGRVSDAQLADLYSRCRALIFPGEEDFGMVPVECLAAGRPVIGLQAGGLRETLEPSCGVFFRPSENIVESLSEALQQFLARESEFAPDVCVERSKYFSPRVFVEAWSTLVQRYSWPKPVETAPGLFREAV